MIIECLSVQEHTHIHEIVSRLIQHTCTSLLITFKNIPLTQWITISTHSPLKTVNHSKTKTNPQSSYKRKTYDSTGQTSSVNKQWK